MHNNSRRNTNNRNFGRYNRPGNFVPASSSTNQTTKFEIPAAAPQAAPPAPAPQPPPAAPEAPPPPPQIQEVAVMKKEDVEMADVSAEEPVPPRHPLKSKLSGVKKVSNKERRRRQNALLRRLTTPKNALMCINEMLPNEQVANQFKVEAAPQDGIYYNNGTHNFCAELTLDGVTYKGYGENKLSARNAAAEQAIRDIVLKKMERYSDLMAQQPAPDADGTAPGAADDASSAADGSEGAGDAEGEALPMIQLLSFALHKLFAEWEGAGHHVPQLRSRQPSQVVPPEEEAGAQPSQAAPPPPARQRKPKKIPDNASSMHPAMLLTLLRPHAAYRELSTEGDKPQNMIFTFAVDVDDETYVGRAPNKKEARKSAARAACKGILGITFDDEKPCAP